MNFRSDNQDDRENPHSRGKPSPSRASNRAETGRAGEAAAAIFLEQSGSTLLERNWRCRKGEIDLIALEGETIVFVEVRSRTRPVRYGTALEAFTPRKCKQVREVASVYLKQSNLFGRPIRFDVVAVTFQQPDAPPVIQHITHAF